MTIFIMPEFDREGWAACLFWLQGGKHNDRDSHRQEKTRPNKSPPGEPSDPPFSKKRREEGATGSMYN